MRVAIVALLGIAGLGGLAAVTAPRRTCCFSESKYDTTRIKATKYAFEAYPSWSAAHPAQACPARLSDLDEYMNSDDPNDAWGHPLTLKCGEHLPPGARGIAVTSAGEDGKEGTCDDIESWDPRHDCE